MKFVAAETIRKAESKAIAQNSLLAMGMMERAGRGLARAIQEIAAHMGQPAAAVRLLAGPGNNGGDAFVAAMVLLDLGLLPEVWLTCPKEKLRGPAKIWFEAMAKEPISWREMVGDRMWQ